MELAMLNTPDSGLFDIGILYWSNTIPDGKAYTWYAFYNYTSPFTGDVTQFVGKDSTFSNAKARCVRNK